MRIKVGLAVSYVSLAILANWLASKYIVAIPFTGGLQAPAGVFAIGIILCVRDWFNQIAGLWRSLLLVYIAGAASYVAGEVFGWTALQKIAIASVIAFSVSETIEAAVFTPLRKRHLTLGVALSSTVGNAIDSWLFLTLAFSSTAFFWGQFWGKTEMIVLGVLLTYARRKQFPVAA